MAMDLPGLKSALETLFQATNTEAAARAGWAGAMGTLVVAIVPAVPPATRTAAQTALETALTGFSASGAAPASMDAAFAAFATALAAGMVPAGATPPPAALTVLLTPAFVANNIDGRTYSQAAGAIGDAIFAWMITGLAFGGAPWS